MNGRVLASILVFALGGACQSRRAHDDTAPSSLPPTPAAPILAQTGFSGNSALPEDPDAGARAVALWHQHLEQEERERRLNYDRRKERQHREVIKTLHGIQHSYDAATNERAVVAAKQQLAALLPQLERSFTAIDHWGVNSKLVPEYRKLVEQFSEPYPTARIAALSGEKTQFATAQGEVAARFSVIDEWLRQAAQSEDE